MTFMDRAELRIAAADHQPHHMVAGLPARDRGAEPHHLAGDFQARNVGGARRRRIEAFPLYHVRPVDAGGGDLHQHLVVAQRRYRAFLRHQHFGSTGRADHDGGHLGRDRAHGDSIGTGVASTPLF